MKKFSDEELRKFNEQGLTDRQIAKILNVTQSAVNYRREAIGLRNNYVKRSFNDEDLIDLLNQGLTDRQIAKILGVTQSAVNYRRERLGQKQSNYIRKAVYLNLDKHGFSDEEIAEKLGKRVEAVKNARKLYKK